VVLAVIAFVGGEVGEAEIGAEVDHLLAGRHEHPGEFGRGAMRQREEKQLHVARGERRGVGAGENQVAVGAAERGDDLGERLAGMRPRGDRGQRDVRVSEEKFD
jgi:hypothetical protein